MIDIPIIDDLNSTEGTEYFLVHLSVHSIISGYLEGIVVSMGKIREAIVYIEDEIIISFPKKLERVKEGENLTLTVTASAASNRDFTITVNITGNDANMSCKLMVTFMMEGACTMLYTIVTVVYKSEILYDGYTL